MTEFDDWPTPSADASRLALLVPGRNYSAASPLLAFAGRVAMQHGWRVRAVSWSAPDLGTRETMTWVGEQVEHAVGSHDGPVTIIAKSLGTCAVEYAAQHRYDAVWLTPLLHLPDVVSAMAANPARQLLIGGTEDPAWELDTATRISDDVVQLEGADHGMFAEDAVRTAENHVDVTRAIDRWMSGT